MNRIIGIFAFVIMVSSCFTELEAVQAVEPNATPSYVGGMPRTKSGLNEPEDIRRLSNIQQNKDHLMLSVIYLHEGVYALGLTREQAMEMGITDEMYSKYEGIVEEMNQRLSGLNED